MGNAEVARLPTHLRILGSTRVCSGRFFTFDMLDAHGGEIRAIGFGNEADRFEPVVNVGEIVEISKASLKPKRNNVRALAMSGTHSIT